MVLMSYRAGMVRKWSDAADMTMERGERPVVSSINSLGTAVFTAPVGSFVA
jgi:hypothetical protein